MLCTAPLKQTTRLGKRVQRWGDELAVILLASGEGGAVRDCGAVISARGRGGRCRDLLPKL